ncbi:MAG: ornithine carbamoyltransferase [Thermoplasmata archaeon]|nr:ornithine carbamoyltransferase [Thermoplasmata archaeon]
MPTKSTKRDLLSIADLGKDLLPILKRARRLKAERRRGVLRPALRGKNVAMIFEKPSTRTRTSFEVGVNDLGGHALYMSSKDLQLGRGETIADTARVLSRYVDGIVYRAFRHQDEAELARHASIPVINALDDREHPCQVTADLLTLYECWKGMFGGHRLAWVGDGNNVHHSLLLGCAMVGLDLASATPEEYRPNPEIVDRAQALARTSGAQLQFYPDPVTAVTEADAVYTDVWVSMGEEAEQRDREAAFAGFQLNSELLAHARPGALVLHDLPAHRGLEITNEVIDGPQSVVWDQAENRLHAQKAILEELLG